MWSFSCIPISPAGGGLCTANATLPEDKETSTSTRRDLLGKTLNNCEQERLRCNLPVEGGTILHFTQQELVMKKRLVDRRQKLSTRCTVRHFL